MIILPFPPEARQAKASGRRRPSVTACTAALLAAALALPAVAATGTTNLPHRVVKWTDASGRVHYGDRQPLHQRGVTLREVGSQPTGTDSAAVASAAPSASGQVAPATTARTSPNRRQPVTLFTTADCDACELGEAWLVHRGIAHERKDVANPADALAFQAQGFTELHFPALAVGPDRLTGFDMDAWNRTLAAGGYPAASAAASAAASGEAEPQE